MNTENVTRFSYKGNDYTILADTVSNGGLGEWIGYIRQLAAIDENGKILLQENVEPATFQSLAIWRRKHQKPLTLFLFSMYMRLLTQTIILL